MTAADCCGLKLTPRRHDALCLQVHLRTLGSFELISFFIPPYFFLRAFCVSRTSHLHFASRPPHPQDLHLISPCTSLTYSQAPSRTGRRCSTPPSRNRAVSCPSSGSRRLLPRSSSARCGASPISRALRAPFASALNELICWP